MSNRIDIEMNLAGGPLPCSSTSAGVAPTRNPEVHPMPRHRLLPLAAIAAATLALSACGGSGTSTDPYGSVSAPAAAPPLRRSPRRRPGRRPTARGEGRSRTSARSSPTPRASRSTGSTRTRPSRSRPRPVWTRAPPSGRRSPSTRRASWVWRASTKEAVGHGAAAGRHQPAHPGWLAGLPVRRRHRAGRDRWAGRRRHLVRGHPGGQEGGRDRLGRGGRAIGGRRRGQRLAGGAASGSAGSGASGSAGSSSGGSGSGSGAATAAAPTAGSALAALDPVRPARPRGVPGRMDRRRERRPPRGTERPATDSTGRPAWGGADAASTRKHVRNAMSARHRPRRADGPSRRGERSSVHRSATASSPSRGSARRRRPGAGRGYFEFAPGGSPANVAVGLSRLGVRRPDAGPHRRGHARPAAARPPRQQRGRSSTTWSPRPSRPPWPWSWSARTAAPTYDFRVAGTADWQWTAGRAGDALDAGERPGGRAALRLAGADHAARGRRAARPDGPGRRDRHRQLRPELPARADGQGRPTCWPGVHELLAVADVVKVSLEDLAWLMPGFTPEEVLEDWLGRGSGPGRGHPGRGRGDRPAPRPACAPGGPGVPVTVIDTVGAGDTISRRCWPGCTAAGCSARPPDRPCTRSTQPTLDALLDEAMLGRGDHLLAARGRPAHRARTSRPGAAGPGCGSWTADDGPRSFATRRPRCGASAGARCFGAGRGTIPARPRARRETATPTGGPR